MNNMDKIEKSFEKIEKLSMKKAYEAAQTVNYIYSFFTDKELKEDPKGTLKILWKYKLTTEG